MAYKVQTPAKTRSGWKSLPDCRFSTREKAEAYGLKYHTDRHGSRLFRVVDDRQEAADHRSEVIVEGMTPIWNGWLCEDVAARDARS
jgi:hypothetical protein